ncbi:hypothetical protein Q7P36_008742 [Cladosporium allicinum]
MAAPTFTREDYTVGIICARYTQQRIAEVSLDEKHGRVLNAWGDKNTYVFGRIGAHNVVITGPGRTFSKTPAATVAKDMMRSFPIKFGIIVGTGSGVWSQRTDVRLGDVVVGSHCGVVQWSYDKMERDWELERNWVFQRTGTLNKPPHPVLRMLESMHRKYPPDSVGPGLEAVYAKHPGLRQHSGHQGLQHDELFDAFYQHVGGDTCVDCDRSRHRVVSRPSRTHDRPLIHYGNIAFSDGRVESGAMRDRIAREERILCFDMEPAGVIDAFPCVVILGICDYADSHKNERWQGYAGITAATYAKELLESMQSQFPKQTVYIPLSKHRQFVGRRAELEILERRIITAPDCQRLAVFGPSGMGKTQLVLNFAYSVAEHHPDISVFWINAVNAEESQRHVEAIARQLRLRSAENKGVDARGLVRRHLSSPGAGNWLLIVDNADDTENLEPSSRSDDLLQYLPQSSLGVTIFTTRSSSAARRFAGSDSLELRGMTRDEATELLETLIVNAESLKEPVVNARLRFLSEVGHVPHAIAAAYINNPKLSIDDLSRFARSTESARSSALDNRNQRAAQRRHRRPPIPYAYPAADTSTAQYTFDGIDSPQTSSAPAGPSPSLPSPENPTRSQCIKPCYIMVVLGFLAIGGSLAVGLYYSIAQDRMGDGFTTAGWMVAVSTLILAAPMAKHYPNCRCWDSHQYAVL